MNIFAPGKYKAQFLSIKTFGDKARLKFFVLNDKDKTTENICTNETFDASTIETILFNEFGARSSGLQNKHFIVEIGINNGGLNSVFDFERNDWEMPQWFLDNAPAWSNDEYRARRRCNNEKYAAACEIREVTWEHLHRDTEEGRELIGCTRKELRPWLERQFRDGMTWDNYGAWEIDHQRPLTSFDLTDELECRAAAHFSNLRPLWKEENRAKYNFFSGEKNN